MKKLLIVLLCLLPIMASAQEVEWIRSYGGPIKDLGVKIISTSDGGYAYLGQTMSYAVGNDDYYLLKLDQAGDVQWTKTYGGPEGVMPHDIIQSMDGGYVMCGSNSNYGTDSTYFVLKVDSLGIVEWRLSNVPTGKRGTIPNAVVQTSDSGFITAGVTKDYNNGGLGHVVKITKTGTLDWFQLFGTGSVSPYESVALYDLDVLSNGSIFVSGTKHSGSTSENWIFASRLLPTGQISWESGYMIGDYQNVSLASAVLRGDTVVLAGYSSVTGEQPDATALILSPDGDSLWTDIVGDSLRDVAMDIVRDTDNGFTAVYNHTRFTPPKFYEIGVRRYDASRSLDWSITIDSTEELNCTSIARTSDGGYIIGGYIEPEDGVAPIDMLAIKLRGTLIDDVPPAAIMDLGAVLITHNSVSLVWTAPGDDGMTGSGTAYSIRYSLDTITESNWLSATEALGPPVPATAGTAELFTVPGLVSDTTYYFAIKAVDDDANWSSISNVITARTDVLTGIDDDITDVLPNSIHLYQNHPNPFNPSTEITFDLPSACGVRVQVFNVSGQLVATCVDEPMRAGTHSVTWNGSEAASGVYMYRLEAGAFVASRKMVLLK